MGTCIDTTTLEIINDTLVRNFFIQLEKIVMNIWVGTNSHLKMLH
jgi:hypothetical protein